MDNERRGRHLIFLRSQFRCCDNFGRNIKFTDALKLIVSRYKLFLLSLIPDNSEAISYNFELSTMPKVKFATDYAGITRSCYF